jgi:RimJ/RimL family protein N-acetyltransferase
VINHVTLRGVLRQADLAIFFEQQLDPLANDMAAFTAEDPADGEAFEAHWDRILAEDSITARTILADGSVAGHIARFERSGQAEITYWLGRAYWGKGFATRALSLFLEEISERPLYARAAKDNVASLRVLEKCGFRIAGEDKGFANARGREVEEFILVLEATGRAA